MIELWSWPTPNGQKVHIALEELGLAYTAAAVDIGAGEQFKPAFLEIAPNNKIPAIVDPAGPGGRLALFESGAILIYLAEKTGRLIPADPASRYICLQWLMFQMGGVGPMFGQYTHFASYAPEPIPYAIDRYGAEVARLYRVINARLADAPYLAGDEYSIADIATFPWARGAERRGIVLEDYPHLRRWLVELEQRPGVQRGLAVLAEHRREGKLTDQQRQHLFGTGPDGAQKPNPRVGTEVPRVHSGR
jgi:GST-like protein